MNRNLIINSAIAALIIVIIGAVFVLENRGEQSAANATTTTSTSTTTVPTSTTTTTTAPPPTTTTTTTSTSTVPPTTAAPLPRELWKVIVVNGSSSGERLQPSVDTLRDLGYVNVRGLVGAVQATQTVIYHLFEGQESAAERLRDDFGIPEAAIAVFDEAPPVAGRNDAQLMVYLGGT